MWVDSFSIKLDQSSDIFRTGEVVSGRAKFHVSDYLQSDGAYIELIGEGSVSWCETARYDDDEPRKARTVWYSSSETYVEERITLIDLPDHICEPNYYDFPFRFLLHNNLPSSFIGKYGKVEYKLRCTIKRPWKLSLKKTLPFSLVSPADLNQITQAQSPIRTVNSKNFGALFFKSAPLSVKIRVPKTGHVPGDNILVDLFVDNQSSTSIKYSELILYQKTKFYALQPAEMTKTEVRKVYETKHEGLGARSIASWLAVPVFVPAVPSSNLTHCNIIQVNYFVKVRLVPVGLSFALESNFDVIIGTKRLSEAPPLYSQLSVEDEEDNAPSYNPPQYEPSAGPSAVVQNNDELPPAYSELYDDEEGFQVISNNFEIPYPDSNF